MKNNKIPLRILFGLAKSVVIKFLSLEIEYKWPVKQLNEIPVIYDVCFYIVQNSLSSL